MKKVVYFILSLIIFIDAYSEEDLGIKYKGLKLKLDTYETKLATSEKLMPIYTEVKYNFKRGEKISPFFKSNLGFSYVEDMEETSSIYDMSENTYYSLGAGVDINHLTIELAYVTYQLGYIEDIEGIEEDRFIIKFKYKY